MSYFIMNIFSYNYCFIWYISDGSLSIVHLPFDSERKTSSTYTYYYVLLWRIGQHYLW